MMSRIRGKNTKPELLLRRALHGLGLRFRIHVKKLPGKPDIVLPQFRAVVHVHGCFWHRHPNCRFATTPASRPDFWRTKFEGTVERDAKTDRALRSLGWRTAVVWECELKDRGAAAVAADLQRWLLLGSSSFSIT
jgi:DNA mismatch endonuclease (patch repair protein)